MGQMMAAMMPSMINAAGQYASSRNQTPGAPSVAPPGGQAYQPPQYFPPQGGQSLLPPAQPTQGGPMTGPMGPLIFDLRQYLPDWALPQGRGY